MRDKPIVYIAGCLDEHADENLGFSASMVLQELGYATMDQYDLPRNKGLTHADMQRFGNAAMGTCDLVCFLPGWEQNSSAVRERALCRQWGKTAVDYVDFIRRNQQMQDLTGDQPEATPQNEGYEENHRKHMENVPFHEENNDGDLDTE